MNGFDRFCLFWIDLLFRILHIHPAEEKRQAFLQFVKFGVIGVTNTLVSYCIHIAVLFLLKPYSLAWDYVAANLIAFLLSVLWSFFWNNRFVFSKKDGQKRNLLATLLKTYVSYSVSGVFLCNILSWLWIDVLGISKFIAPIINLFISVPVNFLLNKFWAYRA